jgi:hypothetical protein
MYREAILVVPEAVWLRIAGFSEWRGRWRFSLARAPEVTDLLSSGAQLPDCAILHLRSLDLAAATSIAERASATGVRVVISTDHEVPQLRATLRLMQIETLELVSSAEVTLSSYRLLLTAFPRPTVYSRLLRAISPRLNRLPDASVLALCREIVPADRSASTDLASRLGPFSGGGGETSISRHLREVGLGSHHRLRRAARLALAIDFAQTTRLNRGDVARAAGFASERTLASTARFALGVSLRDALFAFDDVALASALARFCVRSTEVLRAPRGSAVSVRELRHGVRA